MEISIFLQTFALFLALSTIDTTPLEIKSRITNGFNAGYKHLVWHVLIRLEDDNICNGALISEKWVITAAQCVYKEPSIELWLGYPEMNETAVLITQPSQVEIHPNYGPNSGENDIALLKLEEEIEFNDYKGPIGLIPDDTKNLVGKLLVPSGYGAYKREDLYQYSYNLKQAFLDIISNEDCRNMYTRGQIFDTMLCAKRPKEYDTVMCNGDQGGAAILRIDGGYFIVGIFTFSGRDCTDPSVFTRVSSYLDWINATAGVEPGIIW